MKLRTIFLAVAIMSWFIVTPNLYAKTGSVKQGKSPENETVRDFMEAFCKVEFEGGRTEGVSIRQNAAKYSKKRQVEERKTDPDFEGKVVYLRSSSLYVVGSFRVIGVDVNNTRAVVRVVYQRLARTKGGGTLNRQLIPDCLEHDLVTYDLVYQDKRWWLLDPPLPRVSPEAMIEEFKSTLIVMGGNWLAKPCLSEAQRDGYRQLQSDLEILEGLRKTCGFQP